MGAYEAAEEKKKRDKQQAMGEDGWTVVVRSKVGHCATRVECLAFIVECMRHWLSVSKGMP